MLTQFPLSPPCVQHAGLAKGRTLPPPYCTWANGHRLSGVFDTDVKLVIEEMVLWSFWGIRWFLE